MAQRINYIKNPSFKAGSSDFWSALGSGVVVSSETDTALFGEYSLRVQKASGIFDCGAKISGYRIPVTAGSTYTASAYVRMPEELESRTYTCKIDWYNAATAGSIVSSTENSLEIFNYQVSGLGFISVYATGVAPAGSTYAELSIYQEEREEDASAQPFRFFYIDSVMFEETAYIKGFFESITQEDETTSVNNALKPVPYPEITGMELNSDISLNGLLFNTIDEDGVLWVCTDLQGWWGNSEAEVNNITRGLGDGSYDIRGRYAARQIEFSGVFFPPNKTLVSKAREKLITAIDLVKTNGWLIVDEEPPRASLVRLVDRPEINTVNSRGRTEFSFTLRAHDPIKYEWVDGDQYGRKIQQIDMNSSFTISNDGNSIVPAVFEMHGPMEVGSFIRNLANQQTLTLAQRLRGSNETTEVVGFYRENGVTTLRTNTSSNIVVGDYIAVSGVGPSFNTASALVTSVIDDEIGENFQVGYINEGEDYVRLFITSKSFSNNVATLTVTPDAPNTIYTANTSVVVSGIGGLFNGPQVLTSVVEDTLTYSKAVSPTVIVKAFRVNNVATITTNTSLGVLVGDTISVSSQIGANFNTASQAILSVVDDTTTNTYSISYTNNFTDFGKSQVIQKSIGTVAPNVASLTVTPNYLPAPVNANAVAKLDVNGAVDTSFASNIGTAVSTDNSGVITSALQSDGKILLGGEFSSWNGTSVGRLVRLNSTGTLDGTFNINVGANSNVNALAVQSNGQIVVGGTFTSWAGVAVDRNRLVRLNSDGVLDETFAANASTGANNNVAAIAVQSDQTVIVGGNFTTWVTTTVNAIVKLNSDGTRNTAFTTNTSAGVNGTVSSLALQSDASTWVTRTSTFGTRIIEDVAFGNGIWVAVGEALGGGYGTLRTSTDAITWVTRSISSGFETTINSVAFGNGLFVTGAENIATSTDGITWVTRVSAIELGGIKVAFGNNLWVAVSSFGRLSTSTDATTWVTRTSTFGDTAINSIAFGGGLWVAAGDAGQLRTSTDAITWVTRTSTFGATIILDVAFANGLWVAAGQAGQLRTSTDAITWTTRTSTFGGSVIESVAFGNGLWTAVGSAGQLRTSTDAITWVTRTSTFGASTINSVAFANGLWVAGGDFGQLRTSTEGIIIGGTFTAFNGNTVGNIVRLNSEGTRDTAFSTATGTGANGGISSVTSQPDGKIIITGSFTTWNSVSVSSIIRLNYDGTRDTTFSTNVGTGPNLEPLSIGIQSSGKIIVGGLFTTWDGTAVNRIVRLNSDGTRDTTFITVTGVAGTTGNEVSIRSDIILPDDKIIIAGRFRTGPSFFVSSDVVVSGVDATFNGVYTLLAPTTNAAANIITYAKTGSVTPTPVTSATALVEFSAPAGSVVALSGTTTVNSANSFVESATFENPIEGNPLVGLVDGDILEVDTYYQEVALNGVVSGKRFYLETLADWINLNKGDNSLQLSYLDNPIVEKSITTDVATIKTSQANNFRVGDSVKIQGVDSIFDGTVTITAINSPTSFSFSKANADIATTVVNSVNAVVANVDAHMIVYYRSGWLG
jgi:uncharacterized delta-60 repeat protein